MNNEQLLEAKRRLYSLLLNLPYPTDDEIEMMYLLSRDEQIQSLLSQSKNSEV